MIRVKVDVKGFDRFNKNMVKGVRNGLKKIGTMIERDSRINAPRETGLLKSRHRTRVINDFTVVVEARTPYAHIMERPGRVRREGRRPYMQPAVEKNKPRMGKVIGDEIKKAVGK